jgi:hypothetical protein
MMWSCDGSLANQMSWFLFMLTDFVYKMTSQLFPVEIWESISCLMGVCLIKNWFGLFILRK